MNLVKMEKPHIGQQLNTLGLATEYRTGQSDMIYDFYLPCLAHSKKYDRAVGYFRSTIFHLIHSEMLDFALRGGRVRIICSPDLTADDIEAIEKGYATRDSRISASLEAEIGLMINDKGQIDRTRALATLIAHDIVDIKIAVHLRSIGIYHDKLGIFGDDTNHMVSFRGSANETWNAWHPHGNYESIEVFCSWKGSAEANRVHNHQKYFEDLWNGQVSAIEIHNFPTSARKQICSVAEPEIENIEWAKFKRQKSMAASGRKLFPHQIEAIRNWITNGHKGIFEHATGSGKTFTALIAIKDHVISGNPAIILVPSKLLLRQWTNEISKEIPEATLLKAGDGNIQWKKGRLLRDFTYNDQSLKPRIVLATNQTASSEEFLHKVAAGSHLMVVADECHQTGSTENSAVYTINAGKKLGLSATPVRYGDPEGTSRMMNYFGGVINPIFTLDDAIRAGRLVKYEYHPHAINLTAEESAEWKRLSDKIKKEAARSPRDGVGKPIFSDTAKMLLIRRSRIAKKAINKERLALRILESEYQESEKWLVYCEDKTQLGSLFQQLKEKGLPVNEYHTSMDSDMNSTLEWYRKHGGILVSIRCLDEGVDIPDITHALVLASSQNPRQFIQRRGRVLRRAPGKSIAVLHDAIVVPLDMESETEQMALVKSEFCRAIEFAKGAINKAAASELRNIAAQLGLDIETMANKGTEEGNNE